MLVRIQYIDIYSPDRNLNDFKPYKNLSGQTSVDDDHRWHYTKIIIAVKNVSAEDHRQMIKEICNNCESWALLFMSANFARKIEHARKK